MHAVCFHGTVSGVSGVHQVSLHDSDESTQKAHDQDLVLVMSFLCGLITVMQNKNIYCKLYNDEHSSYHTKTVGS